MRLPQHSCGHCLRVVLSAPLLTLCNGGMDPLIGGVPLPLGTEQLTYGTGRHAKGYPGDPAR